MASPFIVASTVEDSYQRDWTTALGFNPTASSLRIVTTSDLDKARCALHHIEVPLSFWTV